MARDSFDVFGLNKFIGPTHPSFAPKELFDSIVGGQFVFGTGGNWYEFVAAGPVAFDSRKDQHFFVHYHETGNSAVVLLGIVRYLVALVKTVKKWYICHALPDSRCSTLLTSSEACRTIEESPNTGSYTQVY